ncbi:hypothetical protein CN925_08290 [Bacillus sp. AFS055030]|nr:hypothetical protein CN925_08290 [Bacillus sp. AFS055030]
MKKAFVVVGVGDIKREFVTKGYIERGTSGNHVITQLLLDFYIYELCYIHISCIEKFAYIFR